MTFACRPDLLVRPLSNVARVQAPGSRCLQPQVRSLQSLGSRPPAPVSRCPLQVQHPVRPQFRRLPASREDHHLPGLPLGPAIGSMPPRATFRRSHLPRLSLSVCRSYPLLRPQFQSPGFPGGLSSPGPSFRSSPMFNAFQVQRLPWRASSVVRCDPHSGLRSHVSWLPLRTVVSRAFL